MIQFRKCEEKSFRVVAACRALRRCSPALVSNVIAGKRKLTGDRVQDFATILGLNIRERSYLRDWVLSGEKRRDAIGDDGAAKSQGTAGRRSNVSSFLLSSWLHPYVKDSVRLKSVKNCPEAIYRELGGIASHKRIDHSLQFLQHHGYLRIDQRGKLVEGEILHVVGDENADQKIRDFHQHALQIAKMGIDTYGTEERIAQALILPLDRACYGELLQLIQEFAEKLRQFSEKHSTVDQRLYQLILHLTPTGGDKLEG
jgi:uncharacterized protein (TIGR02147 family)